MVPELIETTRHLTPDAKTKIRALVKQAPLSDQAQALVAQTGVEPAQTDASDTPETAGALFSLATDDNGELRGVGIVDLRLEPPVAEFTVDPTLDDPVAWVQALCDELAQVASSDNLAVWDHGAHTPTGQLAQARAWPINRSLVIMSSPLDTDREVSALPDGWLLRSFDPSTDEEGWLALNREAFVDLPDQASWTINDLRARYDEPWFDPAGFLILANENGEIVGAHWTKREGNLGEIYVLAIAPHIEGRGLGSLLTNAGLNQLRASGATSVQLYVDASNTKALRVYRNAGFGELARDTQYLAGWGHA